MKLSIQLTEIKNKGWWLWDETRGMNLSMEAKSKEEALFDALAYYQTRLLKVEKDYKSLSIKVDNFLANFRDGDDYV